MEPGVVGDLNRDQRSTSFYRQLSGDAGQLQVALHTMRDMSWDRASERATSCHETPVAVPEMDDVHAV
jgi:hypothetical protein